ncbi:MAG: thioredoxin TrxC [Deltaproteobacteria bacterium]|nr:thioredoxin TrxC [Deltaproteobacteria bacterium]
MEQQTTQTVDKVEYPCAACGTRNRFPRARAKDDPKCGKCGEKIFPRRVVDVVDATYRPEVEDCPIPVLVDFWAPWCGPCKISGPILERIAAERAGKLKIVRINVDENPRSAARFGVQSIPTMIVCRGPLQIDEVRGAIPKAALDARLDRVL